MFELFIALVGGIYFFSRYQSEQSKSKKFDKNAREHYKFWKDRNDQWVRLVVDQELENRVKSAMSEGKTKNRLVDMELAKHGKTRKHGSGWKEIADFLREAESDTQKAEWDKIFNTWVEIRNTLRFQGVDARLLFVTVAVHEWDCVAYDIDDVSKFRYKAGSLAWLPATYFGDDLKYMSHKDF